MKMVMAVIKPHKLDQVREALTGLGVEGMTATEVKGYGRQKGHTEIYRGAEYTVNFLPKVRIDVVVADSLIDQTVEAVQEAAKTGKIGDGKIFVYDVSSAVRIRTGETGDEAL
ncbi:MAG: transcriptional regulator [Rhodospirillaceae bacterium]|jgi:nitrogen regulatory protein P-II 2|nr:transcriptional regulator [Rhodospirillaceae bacterium]|tara:strand:- start:149 stop:487 length:339 start_codon:yes stop_codon:yes gene_type:complete